MEDSHLNIWKKLLIIFVADTTIYLVLWWFNHTDLIGLYDKIDKIGSAGVPFVLIVFFITPFVLNIISWVHLIHTHSWWKFFYFIVCIIVWYLALATSISIAQFSGFSPLNYY